ncbi:hypothetical protein [Novacetimonas cocois]|uniref:hypothetical protein n=1 Tax=Novacetimonas cocois TaxID=1747507 RepID=UPI0014025926|nr:hypothetical protein [Novacetimonas cocois]
MRGPQGARRAGGGPSHPITPPGGEKVHPPPRHARPPPGRAWRGAMTLAKDAAG